MTTGAENENAAETATGGPDVQTILNAAQVDPALSGPEANETVKSADEIQVANNTEDIKQLLEFAHVSLKPLYPRTTAVYTPEIRESLSVNLAAVMDHFGWTTGDLLKEWGPFIGLGITVGPLIPRTVEAIRQDNAEWNAQQTAAGTNKTEAEQFGGQQPAKETAQPGSLYAKA